MKRIEQAAANSDTAISRPSRETSANTQRVPDSETAAIISGLIDRARLAMGWNRLPQASARGEQSEQDAVIITWWEVCRDAGMRREQYDPCFRAAQQRKAETVRQDHALSIITPYDLVAELESVRRMHAELDRSRLLPENASAACQRCFGTGREEMPDGTVRDGCAHQPLSDDERQERAAAKAEAIKFLRDAARKIGNPAPATDAAPKKPSALVCASCGARYARLYGFSEGDICARLQTEPEVKWCGGILR